MEYFKIKYYPEILLHHLSSINNTYDDNPNPNPNPNPKEEVLDVKISQVLGFPSDDICQRKIEKTIRRLGIEKQYSY